MFNASERKVDKNLDLRWLSRKNDELQLSVTKVEQLIFKSYLIISHVFYKKYFDLKQQHTKGAIFCYLSKVT